MATDQSETDREEQSWEDRANPLQTFMGRLQEAGYEDTLHHFEDLDERVLTKRRLGIVEYLAEHDPESIRELARRLDRQVSAVKDDLDVLARNELVKYETKGNKKAPRLKHRNVFVRPLLLDGEFQWEFYADTDDAE
jgi:predicted transcriptional regulator